MSTGVALEQLAERARLRGRIGFDTEFVSEGRYRALLCLVQLVVEGEDGPEIVVIDALDGEGPGPVGTCSPTLTSRSWSMPGGRTSRS